MKNNSSSARRARVKSPPLGSIDVSGSSCLTQLKDSNTLLTYALVTTPTPVQASPASGPPSVASVTLVVSCPPPLLQVKVTQIVFTFPIADPAAPESSDLAVTATGIGHSVSSSGSDQWTNDPGPVAGSFVVKPKTGQSGVITTQGLTISFPGIQVSRIVGTAWIKVAETATSDTSPAQLKNASIAVPKFPAGFFAGNFAAAKPAIQNGESAILSWSGSTEAIYTMFWGSKSEIVTNVRSWKSPALTETTSFMLSVAAQQSGQTVVLYFSVSVEVLNPDIVAKSVTVNGPATVAGLATLRNDLNVAGVCAVSNIVNIEKTLTVGGLANLAGGLASLNVKGASTLEGGVTVTGTTTLRSQLAALGPVTLIGGVQSVAPDKAYEAKTDGLVIGTVQPNGSSSYSRIIMGFTTGIQVRASGGTWFGAVVGGKQYGAPLTGSFFLPVRAGQRWAVKIMPPESYAAGLPAPLCDFYWFPLGTAQQVRLKAAPTKNVAAPVGKKRAKGEASPSLPSNSLSGSAKLVKGRATVRFGSATRELDAYVVQLTPLGECRGLAVAAKRPRQFDVVELAGGRSNIAFDWTISFPPSAGT